MMLHDVATSDLFDLPCQDAPHHIVKSAAAAAFHSGANYKWLGPAPVDGWLQGIRKLITSDGCGAGFILQFHAPISTSSYID